MTPTKGEPSLVDLYRAMARLRAIDQKMLNLQRQGRIGFYGTAFGEEAAVVGSGAALKKEDWVFPALRQAGVLLGRGFPLSRFIAQCMGNSHDLLKGRQMPVHAASRAQNVVSWGSCIATQLPHAVGAAYAMRLKGDKAVAMAYLGDGATSESDFHVAMNFAAVWKVPVVFFCQNNQWAISVPLWKQTASETIAVKASAYGMPGIRIDGNDVMEVYEATKKAVEDARKGGGPVLLEALTYRRGGHSSSDDPTRYRASAEEKAWEAKDPLARARKALEKDGKWSEADEKRLQDEVTAEVASAVAEAEKAPPPALSTLFEDVTAEKGAALAEQERNLLALQGNAEKGDFAFPL